MKCPHCKGNIGFFSKALNGFGKERKCPHCSKKVKMKINWKILAILLPLAFLFHFFILKPAVIIAGFSGSGVAGISGALAAILSFRLYSDEPE
jgi:hypothetical protein